MTYSEFSKELSGIAIKCAEKKNSFPYHYSAAAKVLAGFMEKHGTIFDAQGSFSFSREDLTLLYDEVFRNKSYHTLLKANCINEFLYALRLKGRYQGHYLNVPQQVSRQLIMDLSEIPFKLLTEFESIREKLRKPEAMPEKTSLEDMENNYLCSFLACAILDGVLTDSFVKQLFHTRYTDLTFAPLTVKIHLSSEKESRGQDHSYLRYWLSPLTEAYFLRLLLFLRKNPRSLKLSSDRGYLFPKAYRDPAKAKSADKAFRKWTRSMASEISIKSFRMLSLYSSFSSIPCFISSALLNEISCDSTDDAFMEFEDSLRNAQTVGTSHETDKAGKKREKKVSEAEAVDSLFTTNQGLMHKNDTYHRVLSKIHITRESIPRNATKRERETAAEAIRKAISGIKDDTVKDEEGFLKNLKFYGLWLILQLSNPKLGIKSINIYASGIETTFLYMLGPVSIDSMSTEKLKETIRKTYKFYNSDSIRKSIISFTNALWDFQDDLFPLLSWEKIPWGTDRSLRKENIRTTKPLIAFSQMQGILAKVQDSKKIAPAKLRAALILGFFAGLRIIEILNLDRQSLIYDEGYVLRIRTSKTKNGIRNIPLSLLIPSEYLKELAVFFEQDGQDANNGTSVSGSSYLFAEKDPFKESIIYSNQAASLFKDINPKIRFHHLRHSFANWFLIRWYATIFGKEGFPEGATFLEEEVFSKNYLDYLRIVLFGYGRPKIGQDSFSHVLPVLARLMGHAGPATTMTSYIHISDWLYHLFSQKAAKPLNLKVKSSVTEEFMQLSYPSLPQSLKKRKTKDLPLNTLVAAQVNLWSSKCK